MPQPTFWRQGRSAPIAHRVSYAFSAGFMGTNDEFSQFCLSESVAFGERSLSFPEEAMWASPKQELSRVLVDAFKEIPQVASICVQFSDEEITVWTLLASHDRAARGLVYDAELSLCQELRIFEFDFRVTFVDLVSSQQLTNAGFKEIFHRK